MSEVEQKDLSSVQMAGYNPRTISAQKFKALKKSIEQFGDLSGVIKNVRTGVLVGGHQRVRAFMEARDASIIIEQRLEAPNAVGTVARGYIVLAGSDEHYMYREVDWDEKREKAANIAANNITGEFDQELLAQAMYDLDPDLQALTGHTEKEIADLLQISSAPETPETPQENDRLTFRLTASQRDMVEQALKIMKTQKDMTYEEGEANGAAIFYICQDFVENNQ